MKTRLPSVMMILASCAVAMACVSAPYQPVHSQPAAAVVVPLGAEDQPFYDELAPYGEWVHVSGPGWVWAPYDSPAGWRPYQQGHWVFTDYGWTWASDESFGWAVYHYGRWHNDPAYGWVWVPGSEWGPAWVAWHEGGGWVGWAPLPWQVRWRAGIGLDWGGININVALVPSSWCFVQARHLIAPGVRQHVAPTSRNVTIIQHTTNVTNYIYVDNRIVDRSVKVEKIGRAVGHTIPRYRVRQADSPEADHGGKVRGEEFVVFRPGSTRGANSQRRPVPPGHSEVRAMDRRSEAKESEALPPAAPPKAARSKRVTGPPAGETDRRPSRLSKGPGQEPEQAPEQEPASRRSPARATPHRDTSPATDSENRSDPPGPGSRRRGPTQAPVTGSGSEEFPTPEPAAHPPTAKPGQTTQRPSKPGQVKTQPAKGKAKKPGEGAAKPDKPDPEAPDSEKTKPDKPEPESPGSEEQD